MTSVWETETFYKNRDIIIIGSGFTGLWSAISMKEKFPKKTVLIIEKNSIPTGASTKNAGFACFGSITELISDAEKMGWEKTLNLVEMRYEGLRKIQHYFSPNEIDFEMSGGFEILNTEDALQKIDEVNVQLQPITKLEKTYIVANEKIEKFGLGNAKFLIENPLEGSLHSGKLLQKLLQKCCSLGIDFLFATEVEHVLENENSIEVHLQNKEKISAQQIVFCTNAFTQKFFPEIDLVPARGQVLLTEEIENLSLKGTFHYDEGFYYFRNVGNKILLGGGRNQALAEEETTAFCTTEFLQNHLEDFLKKVILPHHKDIKILQRWSGIMAMGKEKFPIIQKISERQMLAVRLSGMGVALAPKIGEKVAAMVI